MNHETHKTLNHIMDYIKRNRADLSAAYGKASVEAAKRIVWTRLLPYLEPAQLFRINR